CRGMHRIAAVLNLLTQLNKLSSNNFIRHECQNGILGGCFFILFDGYIKTATVQAKKRTTGVQTHLSSPHIF
ncbi:MAG: hypothetical protein UIH27_00105, partial [Ruminococcus sp.]|nr:hypothetical protein [Ruminococcus sp.]